MKNYKILIIFFIFFASFFYGFGVGFYKWFPFNEILNAYMKIKYNPGILEYERVSRGIRVVLSDTSKKKVQCPSTKKSLGVIVAFGQSNIANSSSYRIPSEEVPNVINWYKGECFKASSPLLGASRSSGEWVSKVSQFLVDNGTYEEVLVLSLGIGGSPISAWAEGGKINIRFIEEIKNLNKNYKITDMIWHQGETDLKWGVSNNNYKYNFISLLKSIRNLEINSPIFISVASYCHGGLYPNQISKAQIELAETLDGVYLGANTDILIKSNMRYDDCHFNKIGQYTVAREYSDIISKFHQINKKN